LKTLFLVRHAKSSWDEPDLPDVERPLNDRGRRAARKMGRRLARRDANPDLVLSSPAIRSLKTARIMARRLGYPRRKILLSPRLYACSANELLHTVRTLDDRFDAVMMVGHSPEMTLFAQRLGASIAHMPTCAVARFTFDLTSWAQVDRLASTKTEFDYPKRGKRE
jgi:phosphohistidine phosphatase